MFAHLRADSLVGRALNKYDDWQISILHTRIDREEAKILEIESIRNFDCIHPNGYNQTRGGDGLAGYWKGRKRSEQNNENNRQAQLGKKHSEETKNKIRAYKHTEEAIEKIRQAGRRSCSKETKKKISESNLGKKHPEVSKRNKENNPMRNPEAKLKWRISCLKTAIRKLEEGGD
jgi:hypothetical protein